MFSFLHSCSPPIVHGNLTCDTIFIQHNGLIKIGSGEVAEPNLPLYQTQLLKQTNKTKKECSS